MSKGTILVVDDEADVREFLRYNLEQQGYQVYEAENGKEGIDQLLAHQPDLILLDIMMPEMDGHEMCFEIRNDPDKYGDPIISFLTARGESFSEISGFNAGADDYIHKPIKPRVLLSRIQGLMRRVQRKSPSDVVRLGDIEINLTSLTVWRNGEEIHLAKKEFELLCLLATAPGKVFSRKQMLSHVWGREVIVGTRTVDVHIRKIREKLGEDLIRTMKGYGYKIQHDA